jgi:hypothetical protein
MVAYRELAKGQDERLQRPETLYSLRQKFWEVGWRGFFEFFSFFSWAAGVDAGLALHVSMLLFFSFIFFPLVPA